MTTIQNTTGTIRRAGVVMILVLSCHDAGHAPGGNAGQTSSTVVAPSAAPQSPPFSVTAGIPKKAAVQNGKAKTGPLVGDGDAVFFVGNSFFGWQDRSLPEWVAALGRALTPPVRIQVGSDILFGNTRLSAFLSHRATQEALASRKYKVFVLQGEDIEPVDYKAEFHQAVRDFNRAIVAAGGRTVLFMTWEFPWRRFIDQLSASYEEIGEELGIPVIPVGVLYKDCEGGTTDGASFWLTADAQRPHGDLHQNQMGSALNTYATFEMLTGINPMGRNFDAHGNTNNDGLMRLLSDLAWVRVERRLRLGQ